MADSTGSGLTIFLRAHLHPGMTVMDIGANVGDITAIAADVVGHTGHVIAYEPGPDCFRILQNRFRPYPNVHVRHAAVSNRSGDAEFFIDPTKSTSSTLFSRVAESSYQRCRVPVTSLDSELPTFPPIDLIKVDAQGAEGVIFEGGRRLLKRDKPLLILELWAAGLRLAGTDPEQMLNRLAAFRYHFHSLNAKGHLGGDDRLRELIRGTYRSAAINVVAHPRRWPSRRWSEVMTPSPCAIPLRHRDVCRVWTGSVDEPNP